MTEPSAIASGELVLDSTRSSIRIHTFAEGLFSRLAHDLELACTKLSGKAKRGEGGKGEGSVELSVRAIEVAGTLKHGRVDPHGLSAADKTDALEKMRRDVFHLRDGSDGTLRIEATLTGKRVALRVVTPSGRTVGCEVPVEVREDDRGATRLTGAFELGLSSIGSDVVRGPMNAFRVKDAVVISFDVAFVPVQPA